MLYRLFISLGWITLLLSACGGNTASPLDPASDNSTFVFFYKDG